MTARQRYPTNDAEQRAQTLVGVSIAGSGSTIGRDSDHLTVGAESRAKAVVSATGPAAPTLLQAYAKWRAAQAAQTTKATESPEERALRKSRKKLRRCLAEGQSAASAVSAAHAHYRKKGGKSSLAVWSRKVSGA